MEDAARARRALARDLHRGGGARRTRVALSVAGRLEDGRVDRRRSADALDSSEARGRSRPASSFRLRKRAKTIIEYRASGRCVTACRDAAAGIIPGKIAVNLSPVQLSATISPTPCSAILVETGLSPARLEIEVTELTMMRDQERSLHTLRALKALGVSIAMDDFGTGHSSLATLHTFPFDKIKLDQSFVQPPAGGSRRRGDRRHGAGARPQPRRAGAGGRHRDARAVGFPGAQGCAAARAICRAAGAA